MLWELRRFYTTPIPAGPEHRDAQLLAGDLVIASVRGWHVGLGPSFHEWLAEMAARMRVGLGIV